MINYNVLTNLRFWDSATEDFAPAGTTSLDIENAIGPNTDVSGLTAPLFPGGDIGQSDGIGEFHAHLEFSLSSGAALGAYGLLLELETDALGIAVSDPFFIVFNYGLDITGTDPNVPDYDDARDAFADILSVTGDVNFDGVVNGLDANIVSLNWLNGIRPSSRWRPQQGRRRQRTRRERRLPQLACQRTGQIHSRTTRSFALSVLSALCALFLSTRSKSQPDQREGLGVCPSHFRRGHSLRSIE